MLENAPSGAGTETARTRLLPVDALRGFIIILMALDHANYFIAQRHPSGEHWGGPFPHYSNAVSFLTRFVTHLSAPGFFFLMGCGIVLFSYSHMQRGWSMGRVRRHFILRGAILIILQFTLVNPIWKLSPLMFPNWYQGVLVALGGTMIISTLLLRAQAWVLLCITVLVSIGIELTHPDPSLWGLNFGAPLGLVLGYSGGNQNFWVNYPVLPWLEFVTFGMTFGHWFRERPDAVPRRALIIGCGLLIAFVPIRELNGFGNIRPSGGDSWIDFLNVVKYPPSWSFTFITMGMNLTLLWLLDWAQGRIQPVVRLLAAFGRVPLFFYISHLLLYALLGRAFTPAGAPFHTMYLFWLAGLAIIYPLTLVYARIKSSPRMKPVMRYL